MQFEQKQTFTNDYDIKTHSGNVSSYTMMQFQMSIQEQNSEKIERFKKRLEEFQKVKTLSEAKELAERVMPVKHERTVFRIGDGKCIVINKEDMLRITFKSPEECIVLNFN